MDKLNPLPNGILLEITVGGDTSTLGVIKQTEDFLAISGGFGSAAGDFLDRDGTNDVMTATIALGGGAKLTAGSGDKVSVTIRDDTTDSGNDLLRCICKGYRETP